jgi:sodium/proline symporter
MNLTIIIIAVIYLLVCMLIGVWATKKTKSSSDFFVAGKDMGMFVMAIAAFSSIQSGFGMVGGSGLTFSGGLGFASGLMVSAPLGFALAWFLIGKRLYKMSRLDEVYSIGDIIEIRYKSKAARAWLSVAMILGVLGYLGTQVQAMGILMHSIFGVSPMVGALIGLGIMGFYSVGGGMIAAVYTDLFQGLIMIAVSVIVFFVAIDVGGGIPVMTQTLIESNPALGSPFGTFPMLTVFCWFFMISLGAAAQPHFLTKFLLLKNDKDLRWGAFTASISYMITTLLVIGIGLAALVINIQGKFPKLSTPDDALPVFLSLFTSPVINGLVIAGLMSAIMSTGSSFVNIGAASIIRDIPKSFNWNVKNELFWSRIAVIGLLALSAIFSFYMNTLVGLLGVFGWGMFASAIFPSVVLGLIWKGATKQGAIGSIAISLVINIVLEIGGKYGIKLLPAGIINGAFALAVSTLLFIVISLVTQPKEVEISEKLGNVIEG